MNEKVIWDFLIKKTNNPYGTAAIMGNLMAESSLNPANATGKNRTDNYVKDADREMVDFIHDGVAFGLVQWCYWSRKEGLWNFAKSRNTSVGNLSMQLEYLWLELTQYKTAYNAIMSATDIRTASDVFMTKYENPAGQGEAAKKKRADYGRKFFDMFAEQKETQKKTVLAVENVNIREGNGKSYARVSLLKKGYSLEWVATAENGWYAVKYGNKVCWVSNEYSKIV